MKYDVRSLKLVFLSYVITACLSIISCSVYAIESFRPAFYDASIWQQKDVAIPFDATLYDLSYQTFLASGNVSDAYLIAKAAVRQQPHNMTWRRHLAYAAQWSSKPNVALQQWIYLVKHEHKLELWQQAFKHALEIAEQIGDDDTVVWLMAIKAKHGIYREEDWRTLIAAQERLGYPNKIITQLEQALATHPSEFLQQQLLTLYHNTGQTKSELDLLKRQTKEQGFSIANAIRQAEIYYNRGELLQAYRILIAAKANANTSASINTNTNASASAHTKPNATKENIKYWQLFSDLAWLLQHRKDAADAINILYQNKQTRSQDLYRLINVTRKTKPQDALDLAYEGWLQYREDKFFVAMLSIAPDISAWIFLNKVFDNLTIIEHQRLERSPLFWTTRAETWQHLGYPKLACDAYEQALQQQPYSERLKADYLWLLLRIKNRERLLEKVQAWQALQQHPFLWVPYANAYLYLGKVEKAMRIFEQQWPRYHHDYIWLNQFAYVLDQAHQIRAAKTIRNHAWAELKKEILQQNKATISQMNIFADLSMYQAPGTTAAYAMAYLAAMATLGKDSDRDTLLNWALGQNFYDLALYWRWRIYQANTVFPDWAALALAIRSMDLTQVHDVIMRSGHSIPAREQIESTRHLADRALIAQTTYNAMQETPKDAFLYREMATVMHESAHYIGFSVSPMQSSLLGAVRTQVETALFPTANIKVMPYIVQQNQHSRDSTQLQHIPQHDRILGFKNKFFNRHGYLLLDVMHRWALHSFSGISLINSYRFNSRLNSKVQLGYNQNSTGTTPLRIAASQDEIRLTVDYAMTARDTLIANFGQLYFHSQKRHYLGRGYGSEGIYNHKFMFEDPDISVSLLAAVHHYMAGSGIAQGELANIIPPGQTNDFSFFVPDSFRQYGASVQFGQFYKENYTARMKPFASYGRYYNSLTGVGYNFEVGVASRLFGRDHLVLSFSQATSQQEVTAERYIALQYHYYYS